MDIEDVAWQKLRREIRRCFNCSPRPKADSFEESQRLYRGRCVDCWGEAGVIARLEPHNYKGRPFTKWVISSK